MNVNVGDLNKRIQIIKEENEKDEDGFPSSLKQTTLKRWAQVTNRSGSEIARNNNDFSKVSTRFLIRTPKDNITTKMFIIYQNNRYDIEYVHNYEDNSKFTEIFANKVE